MNQPDEQTRNIFVHLMHAAPGELFDVKKASWDNGNLERGLATMLDEGAITDWSRLENGEYRMRRGRTAPNLLMLCEAMAPFGWRLTRVEAEVRSATESQVRVYDGAVMLPLFIPRALSLQEVEALGRCRSMHNVMSIIRK